MAAINDLISQIQDETLRNRIQEEVSKMAKQKKFGLVFEEDMPESTPLYDMPIKRGCNVMRRDSKDDKSIYVVLKVEGDTAVCVKPKQKDEAAIFELKDIVRVAEFGESIYPYLKPLDSVCNAPDSDLWHTLIEADNYHALQLLEYLYAGKVDCIYLLNYEDGGSRRCILVTNNEVSDSDAEGLTEAGDTPGTQTWENHGICRAVTWPRTKYSILGFHSDGSPLQKDYTTTRTVEEETERTIKQIRLNPEYISDIKVRKDIVALIGKDKLPQSLVKPDIDYLVSEKHCASILFSPAAYGDWIAALDGQDHVSELYVVTSNNKEFKMIKELLIDSMGAMSVSKAEKIPMSDGFKANAAFFKLGFLDPTAVSLGMRISEMLPTLWLKTGAKGKCPELTGEQVPDMLILPENQFAVLINENTFADFAEKLAEHLEIQTVFLATDYEVNYQSMVKNLNVENAYQLYRDYLDHFRVNRGRN